MIISIWVDFYCMRVFCQLVFSKKIRIAENFDLPAVTPSGYAPTGVTEKYYYYSDQYQDASNRWKDIIDIKHCRGGGPPNVTEQCNEQRCPGNHIVNIMIFLKQIIHKGNIYSCIDI